MLNLLLGAEGFRILKARPGHRELVDKDLEAIRTYFKPVRTERKERVDFYRMSQQQGVSIEKHAVRVREASRDCGFGEREEEMQRDLFVASVADDRVRSKLTEDEKSLLFAEVIEKARTFADTLPKTSRMRPSTDTVRPPPKFPP